MFHLFQPLLYQVATGALSPGEIASPLRYVLNRQRNTRVLLGEVVDMDADKHEVLLLADHSRIAYDTVIFATGSTDSYFGHPEWAAFAPGASKRWKTRPRSYAAPARVRARRKRRGRCGSTAQQTLRSSSWAAAPPGRWNWPGAISRDLTGYAEEGLSAASIPPTPIFSWSRARTGFCPPIRQNSRAPPSAR